MTAIVQLDWTGCALVEVDQEIQGGAPVVRGTRVPASAIVDNAESGLGVAEITEQCPVSQAQERAILTYANGHRITNIVR